MARITIDVDLPPEVEITGYQRYQDGHGLEVRWPLPVRCRCEKCGHDDVAHIEFKTIPQAIRDLNRSVTEILCKFATLCLCKCPEPYSRVSACFAQQSPNRSAKCSCSLCQLT